MDITEKIVKEFINKNGKTLSETGLTTLRISRFRQRLMSGSPGFVLETSEIQNLSDRVCMN
jgi:hypothetical protein